MYPRNAASPERISVGAVVAIADGTVQTSGCSIAVVPQGGASGAGAGTTAYDNGIVLYTPTQGETNYSSFVVTAYKTGCIPASVTVVTTASATAGYAGLDWGVMANKTTTNALTGTTIATTQKVDIETIKTQSVTCAADVTVLASVGTAATSTAQTGDAYARLGAPAGLSVSADIAAAKSDTAAILGQTGTTGVVVGSIAANAITASAIATGAITATKFAASAIDAAALSTDAAQEIRDAVWAKVFSELTVDPGATPAASDAVMLGFMAVRNKRETDSGLGTDKIHNSAGTAILSATISDAAGVFTKGKYA